MRNFQEWLKKVDQVSVDKTGFGVRDFEDWHWRDAFEDEMRPREAFLEFAHDIGLVRDYPELFED